MHNRPVTSSQPPSAPDLHAPLSVAARPELTGGRRIGVLLQHGFTGSPASMKPWGRHLADLGYAVEVPLLPGHGTTWQQMNRTGWDDWYGAVTAAFDRLRADNDAVVVGGLSMGGTLVLRLAEDRGDQVAGVMLVNAAVASTNKQLLAVPLLKHLVGGIPAIGGDIKKPGVEESAYARTPLRALHELVRAWSHVRGDLGRVTQPLVLFRSVEDHVVDPSSGRIILAGISSTDATEVLLEDSYHVATLDHDAERIFADSAAFMRRVTLER